MVCRFVASLIVAVLAVSSCKKPDPAGASTEQPPARPTGEIPPEFPLRLPIYPGAKFASTSRNATTVTMEMSTKDGIASVSRFYRTQPGYAPYSDGSLKPFVARDNMHLVSLKHAATGVPLMVVAKTNGELTEITLSVPVRPSGCRGVDAGAIALADCEHLIVPPPAEIRYIHVLLPPGARDYLEYSSGAQNTFQVRFDLDEGDMPVFEARLPCRLEPLSTDAVAHAKVATNDRAWYVPESAKRHRGCDYRSLDRLSMSVLVDLTVAAHPLVFLVVRP